MIRPIAGTIVESVELSGGAEVPEDLRECLTESTYALDLGPTDRNFAQTLTLVLGGSALGVEAIAGTEIDAASRAKIDAALAEASKHGGAGEFSMIMVGDRDAAADHE